MVQVARGCAVRDVWVSTSLWGCRQNGDRSSLQRNVNNNADALDDDPDAGLSVAGCLHSQFLAGGPRTNARC